MNVQNTIFISYRRTNVFTARAVYQSLKLQGFDVFLDFESIDSGSFEQVILNQIAARAHFVLILTPSALERCAEPNDILKREIEYAIDLKRNIVPLMFEDFNFSGVSKNLQGKLALLAQYNGLRIPADYFDEAIDRLCKRFLSKPLELIVHPTPSADLQFVRNQQAVTAQQAAVTEDQLSAEALFEKAFNRVDSEYAEQIADYTDVIRLNAKYTEAYNNRGLARCASGDYAGALADYDEAIRLRPGEAAIYHNRGLVHYAIGDVNSAIADYTQAIQLNPQYTNAYYNRGLAHYRSGNLEEALADYSETIHLNPQHVDAYCNRGNARSDKGDLAGAIDDYTEAIRLEPDNATAFGNRGEVYFETDEHTKAISDFQRANEIDPVYPYALAGLAICYHTVGNLQKAKAYWKLLVGLDNRYKDIQWAAKELSWHPPLVEEARKLVAKL